MTSAFAQTRVVEARAFVELEPCLPLMSDDGECTLITNPDLQLTRGDYTIRRDGKLLFVEHKAEEEDKSGNLFLETWSNRTRFTPGWMMKCRPHLFWYHFLAQRAIYEMPAEKLFHFAFVQGRLWGYREVRQSKRPQANDTWGRLVPREHLMDAGVITRIYDLHDPPRIETP